MKISGLNKTTLLDYPGKVACTVFLSGCNMRCPFCHNSGLVLSNITTSYTKEEILSFLKKRSSILSGVCITGGEPTLNHDLPDFISDIKHLGYAVKLDTNGSNPNMLRSLISDGLIDYCAMDIKNSPQKYDFTVSFDNSDTPAVYSLTDIEESVRILLAQSCNDKKGFSYEFRTTVVKELHDKSDIEQICQWIKGANAYYLQSYVESDGVFLRQFHPYDKETLTQLETLCQTYIPNTRLRGVE